MFDSFSAFTGSLRRRESVADAGDGTAKTKRRRRLPRFKLPRVTMRAAPQAQAQAESQAQAATQSGLRIMSWNLLRRIGATCDDLARLLESQHVDIALLQEVTVEFEALPSLVGGAFVRHALPGRIHGPAIWARNGLARPRRVPLVSRGIRRHAVLADIDGVSFASVHLSHGQLLCRRQAREASDALLTAAAVIGGDFNMVGPLKLEGFREVGPREPTHYANGIVPVRIDRCFVRGFACRHAKALDRGRSDHRPILLDLAPLTLKTEDRAAA
jgi:endonuclease/exonuclease/phosphatase (EEP) superfamily protein YafD